MHDLQSTLHLAQEVGTALGRGEVLLGALPASGALNVEVSGAAARVSCPAHPVNEFRDFRADAVLPDVAAGSTTSPPRALSRFARPEPVRFAYFPIF